MKVKEESEKVGLKLNIQKTKIMASGPITSWQIDGKTMETVTDFIVLGPKSLKMVTAAMKLKTLAPWKKIYDKLGEHIKKQRDYFADKVMSLLFNMLSRFVIAFFPRSKRLLISWLQSSSAVILEPRKIKVSHCSHCFPSICHEVMGQDAMILVF